MTAIALQSLNFSTKVLERFWHQFVVFWKKTLLNMQMSRQMAANSQLAHMMQHEYPGMTVPQIADKLNRDNLEYFKRKLDEIV